MANSLFRIAYYSVADRRGDHDHVAGWRGRCTFDGHRVVWDKQTRDKPFWTWPGEIVGRFRAMRAGSRPAAARVDAEFIDPADFFDDSGELTDPEGAAAADARRRSEEGFWHDDGDGSQIWVRARHIPAGDDEVVFVDDGLGEEFEAELAAWEEGQDR